ncbi:hypothetical protein CHS0354_007564 [Potamilus streckersoni]|uniref:F-box domain-containing protein n=1 Tax=Potamilus streckersoni TaxID=2493646 RepID=A0AAE0T3T2_9BIVA|nr:hypothetical protein CHS0354_007564 [Potamilus streckersoni]
MSVNELEKFRDQWKKELWLNKETKQSRDHVEIGDSDTGKVINCASISNDSKSTENNDHCRCSNGVICKFCKNIHPAFRGILGEDALARNTMYYPFSIVGNLLHEGSHSGKSEECKNDVNKKPESVAQDGLPEARKRKITGSNLEKKRLKIEDIFAKRLDKWLAKERFLDVFIADLDEINEIPFFDTTLPREVAIHIFKYLDTRDLCSCAQVSRSWKSLAEDELLWCRLCHRLGYEKIYMTVDKSRWKQVVQHNMERQRFLVMNWKGRIGKLLQLEHFRGKVLCAVDSYDDMVVAGYTSGEVKLWHKSDLESTCIFQPSSSALVIDDQSDTGTLDNILTHIATCDKYMAASYSQGNVDIWSLEAGTLPVSTFSLSQSMSQFSGNTKLSLTRKSCPTVVFTYGPYMDVIAKKSAESEFSVVKHIALTSRISYCKLFEAECEKPAVALGLHEKVIFYYLHKSEEEIREIHNISGVSINGIDIKTDPPLLAVICGLGVKLYDLNSERLVTSLYGHTWKLTCINLEHSPPNMLVTGSTDRKIRIYDMRQEHPVVNLSGHSYIVSSVQMDEWKVVSGGEDGFVCVWDLRMKTKLWDWHNRHPVRYCHFQDRTLVVGNIPSNKYPRLDEYENNIAHRRDRGSVQIYDFLADQMTQGVPEICLSTYDEPLASHYNLNLAVPYDKLQF